MDIASLGLLNRIPQPRILPPQDRALGPMYLTRAKTVQPSLAASAETVSLHEKHFIRQEAGWEVARESASRPEDGGLCSG